MVRIDRGDKPIEWRSSRTGGGEFEVIVEASDKIRLEGGKTGHGFVITTKILTSSDIKYVHCAGDFDGTFAIRREADFITKNGVLTFADVTLQDGKKLPVSLRLAQVAPLPAHVKKQGVKASRLIAREEKSPVKLDADQIGKSAGGTAVATPDGVVKVSWSRTDLPVRVDGLKMPPFMGLTSWAAFTSDGAEEAMLMGGLVLFQDEVNPAMETAFASGINVTALHNHFFFDEPKVFFMHIGGEGKADKLASGVRAILDRVQQVRAAAPKVGTSFAGATLPEKSSLTAAPLMSILGGKPVEKDGMVKYTIGRKVKMPCGCEVGNEMGVNTWAAFYGSDDNALVNGDFATVAGELQLVLRALRGNGINIVAIHSHMEGESPHIIF